MTVLDLLDHLPGVRAPVELGADAGAGERYDLVTERMQDALAKLAEARTFPVIG